ncbi:hypothetical protein B9S53_15655 [Arthrospira sp. O9.13F]|nr:hypothetical protein B9S53_15655 [Arthrospira sp. O9.13F]
MMWIKVTDKATYLMNSDIHIENVSGNVNIERDGKKITIQGVPRQWFISQSLNVVVDLDAPEADVPEMEPM